jgi:1-acyl-sn-glycerol-3-phosphate acyltransferase
MSTWYQKVAWKAALSLVTPCLLAKNRVETVKGFLLPEPPFLLLSDHANALDPYVIGGYSPFPIRFMANIEGVSRLKAAFADLVGAYGRRKGQNDMAALRRTFELSAAGDAVGLFPEGDRSWDGASLPLRPGVARLAKKLSVPLVLIRQRGNYLSRPRWAKTPRRGPWTLEARVFTEAEVARYSDGLLEEIIKSALEKDEIKDARREGRPFSGKGVAEGVERLLWQCPVCGKAEDTEGRGTALRGVGDEIVCVRCGARWKLDANLAVRPLNAPLSIHAEPIEDLKDWCDWQRRCLPNLSLESRHGNKGMRSSRVFLSRIRKGRLERIGRGTLRLYAGELLFESRDALFVFPSAEVRGFVDNFNAFSEFGHKDERWRLEFGGDNAAKWCFALGDVRNRGGAA